MYLPSLEVQCYLKMNILVKYNTWFQRSTYVAATWPVAAMFAPCLIVLSCLRAFYVSKFRALDVKRNSKWRYVADINHLLYMFQFGKWSILIVAKTLCNQGNAHTSVVWKYNFMHRIKCLSYIDSPGNFSATWRGVSYKARINYNHLWWAVSLQSDQWSHVYQIFLILILN